MKTEIPMLGKVRELWSQIQAEVEAQLNPANEEEERFVTSPYKGCRINRVRKIRRAGVRARVARLSQANPRLASLPGEIPLKDFLADEAARCSVHVSTIYDRLRDGKYPGVTVRRPGTRTQFVRVKELPAANEVREQALAGEVSLKEFVEAEAARLGIHRGSIYRRIARGDYRHLNFRKVNNYLVFVSGTFLTTDEHG